MDDFLKDFERRRAEREQADRTFTLAGVTLTHKPSVAPEVGSRLERMRRRVARQGLEAQEKLAELQKRLAALKEGDTLEVGDLELTDEVVDDEGMILAADETILACLEPGSHAGWAQLRAPDAPHPLNLEDLMSFCDYLLGRVTGVPTVASAGSSGGRTTTGSRSKGSSSRRARTRTG